MWVEEWLRVIVSESHSDLSSCHLIWSCLKRAVKQLSLWSCSDTPLKQLIGGTALHLSTVFSFEAVLSATLKLYNHLRELLRNSGMKCIETAYSSPHGQPLWLGAGSWSHWQIQAVLQLPWDGKCPRVETYSHGSMPHIYPGIRDSCNWCSLPPGDELHAPSLCSWYHTV